MSALFDSGMFVRAPAWHGEGNVVAEAPATWAEARTLAGLDWEPTVAPLYAAAGMDEDGTVLYTQEEGIQKVERTDTGNRLAVVSTGYHLISHHAMGEIAAELLRDDNVRIETAGSLNGGRNVWALFKLGDPIQVKGDPSLLLPFAALLNAHDGSGALKAIATTVRIVCMNTYNYADADAEARGTVATIHHTANWEQRIDKAREALTGARKDSRELAEWFDYLTQVAVTDAQLRALTRELFWPKDSSASISERVETNIKASEDLFWQFYRSATCEGIRGTAYGAVQALGEYLQYRPLTAKSAEGRRDQATKRTLLSTDNAKRNGARILGEIIGVPLVKARATASA